MTDEIIVIGAGVGGLSAAITLASQDFKVRILEASPEPGGKAGVTVLDGVEVDTGPSILTLPEVFDDLFRLAGTTLRSEVELLTPKPAFRYYYPDGVILNLFHRLEDTLKSVDRTLGDRASGDLSDFLQYARQIWDAGAPNFVLGEAPTFGTLLRLSLTRMKDIRRIDATRTMSAAIASRVEDQHLRWLLSRYATYNGSSVLTAPATLNCIAWVEIGLGGYGVKGGIHALIRAMVKIAEGLGVQLELEAPVSGIHLEGGKVAGVVTQEGLRKVTHVVANADVAHVLADLLPPNTKTGLKRDLPPSMSGYNAIFKAKRPAELRPAHAVLFPDDYDEEFRDIFERDRPPADPTVYLCAQQVCHQRDGWPDAEPLFVMANAPAEPKAGPRDPDVWHRLKERVVTRLERFGLIDDDDAILWERTPTELATRFPGSRGALYGAASNRPFAAFQRPPNRVAKVPGLYFASGSAHPGGGLPLCALSGQRAAGQLASDRGRPVQPPERRT